MLPILKNDGKKKAPLNKKEAFYNQCFNLI